MRLHQRPGDRQPEPSPPAIARAAGVQAVKALEDLLELIGRDPGAAVADLDLQTTVLGTRGDLHPVTRTGVRDGVANQVAQHLGQPVRIAMQRARDRLTCGSRALRTAADRAARLRRNQPGRTGGRRSAGRTRHWPTRACRPPADRVRSGAAAGSWCPRGARARRSARSSNSTWARSTDSGVRSSCEASDTKSRWRRKARSSRSSMPSNAAASTPTSPPLETGPARWDRSPSLAAAATLVIRRSGLEIAAARARPATTASTTASRPTTRNVRRRLAWAWVSGR